MKTDYQEYHKYVRHIHAYSEIDDVMLPLMYYNASGEYALIAKVISETEVEFINDTTRNTLVPNEEIFWAKFTEYVVSWGLQDSPIPYGGWVLLVDMLTFDIIMDLSAHIIVDWSSFSDSPRPGYYAYLCAFESYQNDGEYFPVKLYEGNGLSSGAFLRGNTGSFLVPQRDVVGKQTILGEDLIIHLFDKLYACGAPVGTMRTWAVSPAKKELPYTTEQLSSLARVKERIFGIVNIEDIQNEEDKEALVKGMWISLKWIMQKKKIPHFDATVYIDHSLPHEYALYLDGMYVKKKNLHIISPYTSRLSISQWACVLKLPVSDLVLEYKQANLM